MTPEEISIRDYIDIRIKNVEDKLDGQMQFFTQHFELNALALIKSDKEAGLRKVARDAAFKNIEERMVSLEMTRTFSAGKLWMVMVLFAAVPTVLALIALFR